MTDRWCDTACPWPEFVQSGFLSVPPLEVTRARLKSQYNQSSLVKISYLRAIGLGKKLFSKSYSQFDFRPHYNYLYFYHEVFLFKAK